jgi:signal transduction histidine kinase
LVPDVKQPHDRNQALMAEVAIAEQARIGRDLHDTVGQDLAALALSAERASREAECAPAAEALAQLADGIRGALSGVRAAARGLTRVADDARSLLDALGALAESVRERHGIECRLEADAPDSVSEQVADHLYRIASEAVANAVHHARPARITIRLAQDRGTWILRVSDDGIGITNSPAGGGVGTWIMQSRAAAIDADLAIEEGDSGGTTVTCRWNGVQDDARPDRG